MLKYELKKIFTVKKTIICAISIIVLSGIFFFFDMNTANFMESQKIDKQFSGPVTSQIFIDAQSRNDEIANDPMLFNNGEFYDEKIREEFEKYESPLSSVQLNSIRSNIYHDLELYDLNDNNSNTIIQAYINRMKNVNVIIAGDSTSISFLENYIMQLFPILLSFIIALYISPIFSNEYSCRTDNLILSSKYGKNKLIKSKILAAFITITVIYTFIIVSYFLLCLFKWGMFDPNVSFVMTVPDTFMYLYSPFDYNMGQYFIVMIIYSYIGSIVFGMFVLFLSTLSKNSLLVSITSIITVIVPFIFLRMFNVPSLGVTSLLKLNFSDVMSVRSIFDTYYGFVLGNNVINTTSIIIPVYLVVCIALTCGSYFIFKRHQVS